MLTTDLVRSDFLTASFHGSNTALGRYLERIWSEWLVTNGRSRDRFHARHWGPSSSLFHVSLLNGYIYMCNYTVPECMNKLITWKRIEIRFWNLEFGFFVHATIVCLFVFLIKTQMHFLAKMSHIPPFKLPGVFFGFACTVWLPVVRVKCLFYPVLGRAAFGLHTRKGCSMLGLVHVVEKEFSLQQGFSV